MNTNQFPKSKIATVLIVEDDPGIAELERDRLEETGYRVIIATTAEAGLIEVSRGGIDLVLLDYQLPGGMDGLDFYAQVKSSGFDLPVILVTGHSNEATVIQALRVGVRDFVTKSLQYLDYLPEAIARILQQVVTEKRLTESESRLASVIESTKDAVIVVDADQTINLFNPAAELMFQCPMNTAIGRPLTDFIPNQLNSEDDKDSRTNGFVIGGRGARVGGALFPIEASVSLGRVGEERFYTVVVRDITERFLAEETLRRSEAMLKRAEGIAHIAGWTLVVETETFITSEEGCRICGISSGSHTLVTLIQRVHPEDRPRFDEAMLAAKKGIAFECEVRLIVEDNVNWISIRGEPELNSDRRTFRISGVMQDITDRRHLEEQFRQSQKMDAFGQLAGGVAHDFNNMLTVINGYSELLLKRKDRSEFDRTAIESIRDAGQSAASLTSQLLTFSRKGVLEPAILDPNAVVSETGSMLIRLIGDDIVLTTVLDPEICRIKADPGQIRQVLVNLAVNARDAMPQGGQLTIETHNVVLNDDYARMHANVRPGRFVLISVTDTGAGIPVAIKSRIFEPFFTTKDVGKGTGLGLATVYGILRQSGGHIEVYSELGIGSTFKVYLPSVTEPTTTVGIDSSVEPGGNESILLVEDQEEVRKLTLFSLQSLSYEVVAAEDGLAALKLLDGLHKVDILITDVVMPNMNGRELARIVRLRFPDIKVLYVSGYTDDAIIRHGVIAGNASFLQKPFTPESLARKVRNLLDS